MVPYLCRTQQATGQVTLRKTGNWAILRYTLWPCKLSRPSEEFLDAYVKQNTHKIFHPGLRPILSSGAHCLIPKPGRLREGERNSRKATYRGNPSWQPRRQRRNAYGHASYVDASSLAGSQKNIVATIAELKVRE